MTPERRYGVAVHRDVRIPTGQPGVTLSGDLFLPVGAGPRPVLLSLLPYRRDGLGGVAAWFDRRWFASRGYPTLLVDFRGTGSSDGRPRAPFDPDEADDALDAIAWATRQPWCDGWAGMWGISYGAITAMRTASRRPPALRAIVAAMGMIDPERDFIHPGGTRGALAPLGSWAMGTLLNQLLPPLDNDADPLEQARWRRRMAAEPYLLDLFRHGPGDPVWRARRVDAAAIEVPALCFAGWRDLFVDGMIRAYQQMGGPKRLIAGPWMHLLPHESPQAPIDFLNLALSWWDRWLDQSVPAGPDEPPVSVYVQGGEAGWRAFPGWPPGSERRQDLAGWQQTHPDTPAVAVGAYSGLWAVPTRGFGLPLDQHLDDARSRCHTSPPLTEPVLIAGVPTVHLGPGPTPARVSVKLAHVDPAGRSTLICAGLATGADLAADREIRLAPTSYLVPAGHRLRVAIAGGDFPRVWPLPPEPDGPPATHLTLPVAGPGSQVRFPALAAADVAAAAETAGELGTGAEPEWQITTDPLQHTISVRLSEAGTVRPPGRTREVSLRHELVATAHQVEPTAARIEGSATANIRTGDGGVVTVRIGLSATGSGITATGRVAVGDTTVLDRRWHC